MNQIKIIKRADRIAPTVSSVALNKAQIMQKLHGSNESNVRKVATSVVTSWIGEWRERQTRQNPKQTFAKLFRSDPATDQAR